MDERKKLLTNEQFYWDYYKKYIRIYSYIISLLMRNNKPPWSSYTIELYILQPKQ